MILLTNVRSVSGCVRFKTGGVRTPPVDPPIDPPVGPGTEEGLIQEDSEGYFLLEDDPSGIII